MSFSYSNRVFVIFSTLEIKKYLSYVFTRHHDGRTNRPTKDCRLHFFIAIPLINS